MHRHFPSLITMTLGMMGFIFLMMCWLTRTYPPTPYVPSQFISHSTFGEDWPLIVDSGQLTCQHGRAVIFTTSGIAYAVNRIAEISTSYQNIQLIVADDETTGTKKDIGPLIQLGMELCA